MRHRERKALKCPEEDGVEGGKTRKKKITNKEEEEAGTLRSLWTLISGHSENWTRREEGGHRWTMNHSAASKTLGNLITMEYDFAFKTSHQADGFMSIINQKGDSHVHVPDNKINIAPCSFSSSAR